MCLACRRENVAGGRLPNASRQRARLGFLSESGDALWEKRGLPVDASAVIV